MKPVPPSDTPRLRYFAALEHHMLAPETREVVAARQTSLAGSNHHTFEHGPIIWRAATRRPRFLHGVR
jgi:hypothetical protein